LVLRGVIVDMFLCFHQWSQLDGDYPKDHLCCKQGNHIRRYLLRVGSGDLIFRETLVKFLLCVAGNGTENVTLGLYMLLLFVCCAR